jgi:dihydrofolate synthase/folylpolyglutamate synthase
LSLSLPRRPEGRATKGTTTTVASRDSFDWLFSLALFGIKFGLENMRAITAALDHPERAFRSVHVAGTNGKGSVTAMVEAAVRHTGVRTGRYTSPHLLDLSERFAIDGMPVSHGELAEAVTAVRRVVERLRADRTLDVHPTFFEVTTAVAFELFRRRKVDVAVCEVGLGGRLDATNVLTPVACAITTIAFDHEAYLGHTLREIAAEKAGIIKPHTPVVVGPVSAEAADAIRSRAMECDAPLVWAADDVRVGEPKALAGGQQFSLSTPVRDYGTVTLGLAGAHQVQNAIVAVRLLETIEPGGIDVPAFAVVAGLRDVSWPARLQRIDGGGGREALLDAAHNEQGAAALARHLATLNGPRPLVFAAMRDKNIDAMLEMLLPHVSSVVITRASHPRSAEPSDIASRARQLAPAIPVEVCESPGDAVESAWRRGSSIVVAGSIFLLADVMKELGRS